MDHDRMDPRDRGMSGAEGPPPPPRTTNHRPSDNSRDRRSGKFFLQHFRHFSLAIPSKHAKESHAV
jgi:hypothetical protein